MLTPTVIPIELPNIGVTLLQVHTPNLTVSVIRQALKEGVLSPCVGVRTTRAAVAEDPREGNLQATGRRDFNWFPGEAPPGNQLLAHLKDVPEHFGSRKFLHDLLSRTGTSRVQFTVTCTHAYTHKGLRTAEAREQRDADAEFLVKERLVDESTFCLLLLEEFGRLYRQLYVCCEHHNRQALQRLVTGLELGMFPRPNELSGVLDKGQAYTKAKDLCDIAERNRDEAWAEYSKAYKQEAVRHLVSWAPGQAKELLQTLLNMSINVNEPLRFL